MSSQIRRHDGSGKPCDAVVCQLNHVYPDQPGYAELESLWNRDRCDVLRAQIIDELVALLRADLQTVSESGQHTKANGISRAIHVILEQKRSAAEQLQEEKGDVS